MSQSRQCQCHRYLAIVYCLLYTNCKVYRYRYSTVVGSVIGCVRGCHPNSFKVRTPSIRSRPFLVHLHWKKYGCSVRIRALKRSSIDVDVLTSAAEIVRWRSENCINRSRKAATDDDHGQLLISYRPSSYIFWTFHHIN
jgi:hypothetical protein